MTQAENTVAQPTRGSYGDAESNAHSIERLWRAAINSAEPTEAGTPAAEVADAIINLVDDVDEEEVEQSIYWAFRRCRAVAIALRTAILNNLEGEDTHPDELKMLAEAGRLCAAKLIRDYCGPEFGIF